MLPTPATPFLGRERELYDAVSLALTDAPRVLTVLGPGGIGKTRFAIELSRLLAEAADGGTVFVSLAALRDAALVLPAVAEALGAEDPSPEAIAARVGGRRTHVLLDNVEQLLPEVASDLASLVEHAVELRLLVTSREALGIGAETRFDLPPLSHDEAVTFFVERARRVRPGIEPGEQVGVLCERLDRLPLALELAAARTRLLPVDALLARLSTRLDLPGPRDADPRHATLRTTIDWSHDLLSPEEQDVFARLAIFPGGCTLEAAEEVCGADLDTVGSLLDKSLVRRRADADGADRYWMLQTIHEFARTRLAERPERDALSQRHAEWILELSRSSHLSSESSGRTQDFGRVLRERDGIRSAVGWATEHDPPLAADIVNALEQYWTTSATPEGLGAVEALLERADALSEAAVARLLRTRGALLIISGDLQGGEESYRSALAAFRRLGDETNAVGLLSRFAVHEGFRGDPERTRGLIEEIRAANASVGNPLVEPQLLSTLARLATREGDLETALELSCRSAELAKALGLTLWRLWELDRRLDLELALGRLEEAEATGVDGLEIARRLDDRRVTVSLLTGLALAALGRSDETRAGTLWGAVLAARDEAGARPPQDEPRTAPLRNCAGVAFGSGVAEGRLLTPEQAAAFALGQAHTEP